LAFTIAHNLDWQVSAGLELEDRAGQVVRIFDRVVAELHDEIARRDALSAAPPRCTPTTVEQISSKGRAPHLLVAQACWQLPPLHHLLRSQPLL
jgi:hypothetical protein